LADDDIYSRTLAELDSIANAAMTAYEREMRAGPVLTQAGLSAADVCSALAGANLGWNERKASAFGVSPDQWLMALGVAGIGECDSLGKLLGVIHRAESAAAMLRAGYKPDRDGAGHLTWAR
jgi:hypothetical protein